MIIVIGDVHAKEKNMEIIKNSFEFLFSTDYFKKAKYIVFQGDVFDVRKSIDVYVLNEISKVFDKMKDKKVKIIVGNHDMYNRTSNEVTSLDVLERMFDNIEIIKKPSLQELEGINIYMLPYGTFPNEKEIQKSDYILGHLEIYPFFPDSDIDIKIFKGKKVFMGHQHKFDPDNTPYMGSFFTTSYAETDNQKHFLFIESKNKYHFFKNEADILHLNVIVNNNKIYISYLKQELFFEEINKETFNQNFKYLLKGKEKDIDSFLRILSEKDIFLQTKISIEDESNEAEEIKELSIEDINNTKDIFSVLEEKISNDKVKSEVYQEIKQRILNV